MNNDINTTIRVDQDNFALRSYACPLAKANQYNEDNFLIIDKTGVAHWHEQSVLKKKLIPDWPIGRLRLAVLDGVGGHDCAEQISQAIAVGLANLPLSLNAKSHYEQLDNLHLEIRNQFADAMLVQNNFKTNKLPGSTLTTIEIHPDGKVWLYHVGDSRLWTQLGGQLELLTIDHNPVTLQLLKGEITTTTWWQQTMLRPQNQILQAFGLGSSMQLSLKNVDQLDVNLSPISQERLPIEMQKLSDRREWYLEPRQVLLLATDGLWCMPYPKESIQVLQEVLCSNRQENNCPTGIVNQLIKWHAQSARNQSVTDNTTILCYQHS